jgi:hypothetical protein
VTLNKVDRLQVDREVSLVSTLTFLLRFVGFGHIPLCSMNFCFDLDVMVRAATGTGPCHCFELRLLSLGFLFSSC